MDASERCVIAPLAARGVEAVPAVWDDPAVDWSAFDLVVLRATWDYAERHTEFLEWVQQVAAVTPLANPPAVVEWNADKTYLADLAAAGVPVVPTMFLRPGDEVVLPDAAEVVVKPAVSAGSRRTARYSLPAQRDAAVAHVAALHAEGRTVMAQPYLASVDERGETALLFVAGRLSHAIRKGPLLTPGGVMTTGLFAEEEISPRTPSTAEREVADAVLAAVPVAGDLLYARVDLLDDSGEPVLLELELIEPSLFLDHAGPEAAERLAAAIVARLGG